MRRIVGFGAERIELPVTATREEVIERRIVMLSRCLNLKTMIAFVGSGCSMPFRYPSWPEMAAGAAAATHAALLGERRPEYAAVLARLDQLQKRAADAGTDDLKTSLGYSQRISEDLAQRGGGNPYRDYLANAFDSRQRISRSFAPEENPYVALQQLKITRFVTTNYDFEIERALCEQTPELRARYGLDPRGSIEPHLSFTQRSEYYGELARFVLGIPGDRPPTVFHCHGRHDDPDSMIVTEADYQRFYLRDDLETSAFRQNLEILFGSNPILFVGFGMRDADLLQAFRILNAADPMRQASRRRSLFALMEETPGDPAAADHDDRLLSSFGVHRIPFDGPTGSGRESPTAQERGRALCRKLRELRERWLSLREEFIAKPTIRRITMPAHPPHPYRHYAIANREKDDLAPDRAHSDLQRIRALVEKPGIVVVHGSGGSGKSWRVLELLDEVQRNRGDFGFDGIFFWSSYYANDWVTGLDRALFYLGSEADRRLARLARYRECLEGKHLLVFDGFERLLRHREGYPTGTPYSGAVRTLLEHSAAGNSTVILTTRLMPSVLRPDGDDGRVREFAMRRLTTDELAAGETFKTLLRDGLTMDDLSSLCSLCEGHSYALALAAAYLRANGRDQVSHRACCLRQELSDVSPLRRLPKMIDIAVHEVVRGAGKRAGELLRNLAIFMSPATNATMEILAEDPESLPQSREALLNARLIFEVAPSPAPDNVPAGYTVHPMVRSFMFESAGADFDALPNFTLAGFTSGNAPVYPGNAESVERVTTVFRNLCKAAETAHEEGEDTRARDLCRSALGVMRSRMEANTAPRWTTYDRYLNLAITLSNLVKNIAPERWDYLERTYAHRKESAQGPLYADELAWLWNDIGLAFYAHGAMQDAYAVWELCYEIDRVVDSHEEGGQYIVQSKLEMAGVFLEMGRLDSAAEYLLQTEQSNQFYDDPDYAGRIAGYKGIIAHLRGNTAEAHELYSQADDCLRRSGRNLRARSFFALHDASVVMIDDIDGAQQLVQMSRSLAEEGDHVDLIAYAREAQAHLWRRRGKFRKAQLEYDAAFADAHRIGIRRLESSVLCELARLALDLGDWETARSRATASLIIANELRLGLRCTHGLVVLGRAAVASGHPRLGGSYLLQAYKLAKTQNYLMRAQEAEQELRKLGIAMPQEGGADD